MQITRPVVNFFQKPAQTNEKQQAKQQVLEDKQPTYPKGSAFGV